MKSASQQVSIRIMRALTSAGVKTTYNTVSMGTDKRYFHVIVLARVSKAHLSLGHFGYVMIFAGL